MRSSYWFGSRLVGAPVRNRAGTMLGTIAELVVEPATARIEFAVIALESGPGMAQRFVAVPWNVLGLVAGEDDVLLDTDRIAVEGGPSFTAAEWPDFADPAWRRQVYSDYRVAGPAVVPQRVVVEPQEYRVAARGVSVWAQLFLFLVFIGLASFAYLVATRGWEQAKSEILHSFSEVGYAMKEDSSDATLTAKVKTALSLNKNVPSGDVHVDSDEQVVTLRGRVPNEQARAIAGKIAGDTPGVLQVDNELEVAPEK